MLRREQKIRNVILFTLFSILFIGVGYAVISSNLKMNGSMTLNKITWDVHLENFEELYDNTVHGTNTFSNENTNMTYTVSLNKPGDIYEFTIDVVNAGNIDAMLSALDVGGLDTAQQAVIEYSVKYLDGSTPTIKDALKVGESETFVITLKTKADITNDKLSATDTNLTLNFNPTYAQADKTSTERNENLSSKIIALNGGKNAIKAKGEPERLTVEKEVVGMYSLLDDYGDSFFYRGKVNDNSVIYNNICWKIIRINGNGTIRVIYNGTASNGKCDAENTTRYIGYTKFNEINGYNSFVGYMYGRKDATTYEETHKNIYDSTAKQFIDTWYENTFNSTKSKYISDTNFCGDRTIENGSGTGIGSEITEFYGARSRYDLTKPILTCPRKDDRYTVNDTIIGNGQLKYPVATINADEVMLSGIRYGASYPNKEVYLYTGVPFWTMSPISNLASGTTEWVVDSNGTINFGAVISSFTIRPVINLKQGSKITSGNGTPENPYVIS